MITQIALLIIAFLGVFAGTLLAFIAPEELRQGKRYFKFLKIALFVSIVSVLFYFKADFLPSALISLLLIALFFIEKEYSLLSAVIFISLNNTPLLILESSLIFIYGLPTGTLFAEKIIRQRKLKILKGVLKNYGLFLIIGLALMLIWPKY